MKIQPEIETWASMLNESEKDSVQREIGEDVKAAAKICAEEDDSVQEDDTEIAEGFTDVRLPRDRVKRHPTDLEVKYWVAVDEYSELLTNYGWFVDQNLNKIPVANNTTPSVTNDLQKAIALAKRASAKWPNYYVMIGKDDHSRGAISQKNYLRSGTIVDCWIPRMKCWRDGVVESEEINVVEAYMPKKKVYKRNTQSWVSIALDFAVEDAKYQPFDNESNVNAFILDIETKYPKIQFEVLSLSGLMGGGWPIIKLSGLSNDIKDFIRTSYCPSDSDDLTLATLGYDTWNEFFKGNKCNESCNEAGIDVMDNWRKMQAEKAAQKAEAPELPAIKEITITGAQVKDSRALVQYDIKWSDGKEEKDNIFNADILDDEFIKTRRHIRSKSNIDTAIALLQASFDASVKTPISWMYYNPKTGVRASENQFVDIKSGKARLRGVKTVIDPAKEKAFELAYRMNQQFGNSRLRYKVEAESQIDETSKLGQPFMHDAETDGPIVTVKDLKEILKNFDDNDVINVYDTEGVSDRKLVRIWNAEYENITCGLDSDPEEHICYFSIEV